MAVTIGNGRLIKGGAVVETSGGTKYAVFGDVTNVYVYKDIDGIPSLEETWNPGGAAGWSRCSAALDSNDKIHIAVSLSAGATEEVLYRVFLTATDSWEAAEATAASYTDGFPTNPNCSISIDSSDIPHILYVDSVTYHGTDYDQVSHAWDDGGWNWACWIILRNSRRNTAIQRYLNLQRINLKM